MNLNSELLKIILLLSSASLSESDDVQLSNVDRAISSLIEVMEKLVQEQS